MKAALISLLVIFSVSLNANAIRFDGQSAPVHGQLQIDGITRNMTTINPRLSLVVSASITFNDKQATLSMAKRMPACAPNMMCIQVMPSPLNITLAITSTERTECIIKRTAVTPKNEFNENYEVLTFTEKTNSPNCIYAAVFSDGNVTYQVTGISSLTKQQETATANFSVVGNYIRAQN
jgi:hypothetical protein